MQSLSVDLHPQLQLRNLNNNARKKFLCRGLSLHLPTRPILHYGHGNVPVGLSRFVRPCSNCFTSPNYPSS